MDDLDGKVVLITGAGRGKGAAMARVFAARGAAVGLGARSESELRELAAQITASGGRATCAVTDVIAAAVPVLRAAGTGHFATIGSTSGAKWVPGQGVYAATKAAARAVTDVLRQELAPTGIRVTYVSPGFTATGFVESTRDPEERAALVARRGAIAMPPEAVAEAVLFAISQPALVDVGELTIRPTVRP